MSSLENHNIQIYDINKQPINHIVISTKHCFYFYSHTLFDVKITNGIGVLFSVNPNTQLVSEGTVFTGKQNYGYTLFIDENLTAVDLEITTLPTASASNTNKQSLRVELRLDNVVDEHKQKLYDDLLVNNHLPTLKELQPALLDNFGLGNLPDNLMRRMFLDFKDIMRSKGTTNSIHKFLEFIGFENEQIKVVSEYIRPNGETIVVNPDYTKDRKTGNYYVSFDNWEYIGSPGSKNHGSPGSKLDSDNLPLRKHYIHDNQNLLEKLKYAIAIANTYFTLVEEDITFFGITNSVNIPCNQMIGSSMNQIFVNDVYWWRKTIDISISSNQLSENGNVIEEHLVTNTIQHESTLRRNEIKYIVNSKQSNNEMFLIDKEIQDNEYTQLTNSEELSKIHSCFGSVINISILAPNKYVSVEITNKNNPFTKISLAQQFIEEKLSFSYVITKHESKNDYQIKITIHDMFGNREVYTYNHNLIDDERYLDIDMYQSGTCNFSTINDLTIDIDSTQLSNISAGNHILLNDSIPKVLSNYFQNYEDKDISENYSGNKKYALPDVLEYIPIEKLTETVPVQWLHSWIECLFLPASGELKYEPDEESDELSETLDELSELLVVIKLRNVIDDKTGLKSDYYMITTSECGININRGTYDIKIETTNGLQSIYEQPKFKRKVLQVNYSWPLFGEFVVSSTAHPTINSLFQRLDKSYTNLLKIGDVAVFKLNSNSIVQQKDIVWKLYDAFTDDLILVEKAYSLKFRVNEETIYNLVCEFTINNKKITITKKGILSSWKTTK